jgi:hypothetical protein
LLLLRLPLVLSFEHQFFDKRLLLLDVGSLLLAHLLHFVHIQTQLFGFHPFVLDQPVHAHFELCVGLPAQLQFQAALSMFSVLEMIVIFNLLKVQLLKVAFFPFTLSQLPFQLIDRGVVVMHMVRNIPVLTLQLFLPFL